MAILPSKNNHKVDVADADLVYSVANCVCFHTVLA